MVNGRTAFAVLAGAAGLGVLAAVALKGVQAAPQNIELTIDTDMSVYPRRSGMVVTVRTWDAKTKLPVGGIRVTLTLNDVVQKFVTTGSDGSVSTVLLSPLGSGPFSICATAMGVADCATPQVI